jgi:hypothetical protein
MLVASTSFVGLLPPPALANAAIAASRVASEPWSGVRSSWP